MRQIDAVREDVEVNEGRTEDTEDRVSKKMACCGVLRRENDRNKLKVFAGNL